MLRGKWTRRGFWCVGAIAAVLYLPGMVDFALVACGSDPVFCRYKGMAMYGEKYYVGLTHYVRKFDTIYGMKGGEVIFDFPECRLRHTFGKLREIRVE